MLVYINQKQTEIVPNKTLKEVLLENNYQQFLGIAVAINDMVIPKSFWDDTFIQENDHILIITATAGG